MVRGFILLLSLGLAGTAAASPGKVKKAVDLFEDYEGGDREALDEALAVLEPALAHAKVEGDVAAWALFAHLLTEKGAATRDQGTLDKAVESTNKALEMGVDGAEAERAIDDLKAIQGLLLASMEDALAGKRIDEAWARLQAVLSVRDGLASRDVVLSGLEEKLLRNAIIVSVKSKHLDAAKAHHQAFFAEGWFDAGIASMLAKGVAEAEGAESALAFLVPLREEHPGDERLLRAHVAMLGESTDEALAVLDAAREQLWSSVSGALLLAELYLDLDAGKQAVEAYQQVLTLDERHRDALYRSALYFKGLTDDLQERLEEEKLSFSEKKELIDEVAKGREEVVALLERARATDRRDKDVLAALVEAYRDNDDEEGAAEAQGALEALESE